MSTLTLDRTRDFGIVCGDHEHGAHSEQDGFFFDAADNLIEGAMDDVARARLERLQQQEAAIAEARAKFAEMMPTLSAADVAKVISADNLKPKADDGEIDLVAWANGTKTYLYSKVAQKIRADFNQSPVNKAQALEILAAEGLIAPRSGANTIPATS